MPIEKIEVECPYCGRAHVHSLEYGDPTIIAESVENDRESKDDGAD